MARLRPELTRLFFVAAFVALRVELFADFVTAFRFGVNFDFFAAAFAGARFFAGDVFAFVRRLVGLTAAYERPLPRQTLHDQRAHDRRTNYGADYCTCDAPPSVLLAAPFSSLERISFFSSSVIWTSLLMSGLATGEGTSGTSTGARS